MIFPCFSLWPVKDNNIASGLNSREKNGELPNMLKEYSLWFCNHKEF